MFQNTSLNLPTSPSITTCSHNHYSYNIHTDPKIISLFISPIDIFPPAAATVLTAKYNYLIIHTPLRSHYSLNSNTPLIRVIHELPRVKMERSVRGKPSNPTMKAVIKTCTLCFARKFSYINILNNVTYWS